MAARGIRPHLGHAARTLRQQHGFKLIDVATRARVSEATVHAFETGTSWSFRTDQIVAAYALEAGVEPADIWQRALDTWRQSRRS